MFAIVAYGSVADASTIVDTAEFSSNPWQTLERACKVAAKFRFVRVLSIWQNRQELHEIDAFRHRYCVSD